MGVFFYSNKKLDTSKIQDVFRTRGHKNIVDHKSDKFTLVTAPKIIVKNVNFLSGKELGGSDSDFAVGVGTYFYNNSYGVEALKKVYENLENVLKDNPVYGHWAFCIRKADTTYIFNDMSGFMRVYCVESNGTVCISTSELAVISTIESPKFDKAKLTGYLSKRYGREAPFIEGLDTINPYKYLVIKDGEAPKWIDREIPEIKRFETFDEAKAYIKELLQEQTDVIKASIGDKKVLTNGTGGLDSRLLACTLRSAGIYFDYINYPIYGPDSEIAEILSKGINRKLFYQTNIPCGGDYDNHYGEFDFGHNFLRQYPNPRWKLEHDFEFSGARGEVIDTPDIVSDTDLSLLNDPRPEVFLNTLMTNNYLNKESNKCYIDYLLNLVEERLGFKKDKPMSEQQMEELTQFLGGQFADSMYNSGSQAHEYFYSLYNEWHFNHFVMNIAIEAKKGRKLTLALITELDKELGSFPFVSRINTRRESVNEVKELPVQYKVYSPFLKKIIPVWMINLAYNRVALIKSNLDKTLVKKIDFDFYSDVIRSNHVRRNSTYYFDLINRLYSLEIIRKKYNITK